MKKISIKLKVTLWLALLMLLIVALSLSILFDVSEKVLVRGSREAIINVVTESFSEIEYDDGELTIDDDLDFFTDGVYISVYDDSKRLLYGRLPSGFTAPKKFTDDELRAEGAFYVYDARCTVGSYGDVWVRGIMSASASDDAFSTMVKVSLFVLPLFAILTALGGYVLINRAFKPFRTITAAAERISSGNDLSERISLSEGDDEIYTLAATFDRMLDRLERSFATEKQFTSDASHELRTPTAVIIAQCEYALEGAKSLDEARTALSTVLKQAQRMSALISQLLTLSRADSGKERLNPELINFSELTELVTAQIEEQAARKSISVSSDIEPELLLRGDETMLMRMLLNLMENAVKYGREGGYIAVRVYRNELKVIGEISDNGIGISEENRERIWERFFQADSSRSSANDGMGLGLTMVKYIINAHGGDISVKSVLGEGSTFTFSLPIR